MRHDRDKLLDQSEVGLVEANVDLTVNEGGALLLRRLGDDGVAVAEVGDSDARGEVEHDLAADRKSVV